MRDLRLEIGRQVNNVYGVEWAFLRTDAAADAESFGDEGDFAFWCDFDAKLACANDRTTDIR